MNVAGGTYLPLFTSFWPARSHDRLWPTHHGAIHFDPSKVVYIARYRDEIHHFKTQVLELRDRRGKRRHRLINGPERNLCLKRQNAIEDGPRAFGNFRANAPSVQLQVNSR